MPRCKPGDLAVVIRDAYPEWIGVIVTVVELNEPWTRYAGQTVWRVTPHCSLGKRVYRSGYAITPYVGQLVFTADSYLRPIRPGELEEDVTRDEVIEA